jgi:hypothetical protein
MRVIAEISHPQVKISIFYMNQKYIIKFEMHNLEQTYKLSELDYIIKDLEDVKKAITPDFVNSVLEQFENMLNLQDKFTKDL